MGLKSKYACSLLLILPLSILWGQAINNINSNKNIIESVGWNHTNSISSTSAIIFQDDMNGDNSVSALEGRGWVINNFDGGGLTAAWYSGITRELFG